MKKAIIFLSTLLLIATSCKNHLSRESAKEQIIKTEGYPKTKSYDFPKEFTKDFVNASDQAIATIGEDDWEKEKAIIEGFEKSGLIKFEETPQRKEIPGLFFNRPPGFQTWTSVKVSINEDERKYVIKEDEKSYTVKLWDIDIDDISGVKEMEGGKTTIAEYSISNKNITPFGNNFNEKNAIMQKTSYFSKYDDGWRLTKN
jgi:hypothetical protein